MNRDNGEKSIPALNELKATDADFNGKYILL